MRINLCGAFVRNFPFGTELAFKKGFDRLGGHVVTTVDPSQPDQHFDPEADASVVFKNADGYYDQLDACKGKKIVYQPDDLRFSHIKDMMVMMREHCEFAFTFDDDGAIMAESYGYKKAKKLLLTADDDLYRRIPGIKKDIDFCFVGSLSNGSNHRSRVHMINVLQRAGFNVTALHDLYDIEVLNEIYNRSKIVLNHATDVGQPFGQGFGYQCRHIEVGFTGSCLLSNKVTNDSSIENFYMFHDEESLRRLAHILIRNSDLRQEVGELLYRELKEYHTPQIRALQMINFIKGL